MKKFCFSPPTPQNSNYPSITLTHINEYAKCRFSSVLCCCFCCSHYCWQQNLFSKRFKLFVLSPLSHWIYDRCGHSSRSFGRLWMNSQRKQTPNTYNDKRIQFRAFSSGSFHRKTTDRSCKRFQHFWSNHITQQHTQCTLNPIFTDVLEHTAWMIKKWWKIRKFNIKWNWIAFLPSTAAVSQCVWERWIT